MEKKSSIETIFESEISAFPTLHSHKLPKKHLMCMHVCEEFQHFAYALLIKA